VIRPRALGRSGAGGPAPAGGGSRSESGPSFRLAAVLAWLLLAATPARALDPARTLAQYRHDVWTTRDGAPGSVTALAQTDDGFLWLATPGGLVRYDGVRFETVRRLGGRDIGPWSVTWVAALPGNGLWLGFVGHGAGRLQGGVYTAFGAQGDWATVRTGAVDADGVAWLESSGRLWRIEGTRREAVGAARGGPASPPWALVVDRAGALYVSVADGGGVYRLRRGAARFERLPRMDTSDLAVAPDGRVWGGSTGGVLVLGPGDDVRAVTRRRHGRMLFDRDGGLWTMGDEALHHVGDPARWLREGDAPALLADAGAQGGAGRPVVNAFLEDRAGDVWLGTTGGLERYRENRLVPVRLPRPVFDIAVAPAADGGAWAASWVGGPIRVAREGRALQEFPRPAGSIKALYQAPDGTLWGSDLSGIWRLGADGRVQAIAVPREVQGAIVRSLAVDADGALWAASGTGGRVGRLRAGAWDTPAGTDGLPARWDASALYADAAGVVWAGTTTGEVLRIEHGRARRFERAPGALDTGPATAFFARGARLWVAGVDGVSWFDGVRFHALRDVAGAPLRGVRGLAETAGGELWLQGLDAVLRVPAGDLARALADPRVGVGAERLDVLDGLDGAATDAGPRPSLVEASDGRLWFATTAGLAWVDPARARVARAAPRVLLVGATVDGQARDVADGLVLPPLTRHLEIAYTATALAVPERVRFRYRLAGVEADWQDAGARRAAFYNDLAPGAYRFEVASTDEDGAWQPAGAALRFEVAPAWYQTAWFRGGLALAAAAGLWLAMRLRVRHLTARAAARLRIRQVERERIARELHDTLLQDTQGLVWRFAALAQDLPEEHPVRRGLGEALDDADAALAASRDRIMDLREPPAPAGSFVDELVNAGIELSLRHGAQFHVTREGEPVEPAREAAREIRRIVGEALHNAFRHAQARDVELEVRFEPGRLRIVVRDDGRGIDEAVARAGRPRHFGLAIMRERAQALGGTLRVGRAAGGGTEVTLEVPCGV